MGTPPGSPPLFTTFLVEKYDPLDKFRIQANEAVSISTCVDVNTEKPKPPMVQSLTDQSLENPEKSKVNSLNHEPQGSELPTSDGENDRVVISRDSSASDSKDGKWATLERHLDQIQTNVGGLLWMTSEGRLDEAKALAKKCAQEVEDAKRLCRRAK